MSLPCMSGMPEVSIIIVNYNTLELTSNCIDSIFRWTQGVTFEVIVVDNGSLDGSITVLSCDKRIRFIPLHENVGFGRANNRGMDEAYGKYFFLLNSDTLLFNNAVKLFLDFMESRPELNIGALGCRLIGNDGRHVLSFGNFPSERAILRDVILRLLLRQDAASQVPDMPDEPVFRVDYVTGAGLFIRRSVVETYGGFDPDFFMYYEDTEWQYRMAKSGHGRYVIDTPEIVHLGGGSSAPDGRKLGKPSMAFKIMVQRSQFLYMRKTRTRLRYLLFRAAYAIVMLPAVFYSPTYCRRERMKFFKILFSRV